MTKANELRIGNIVYYIYPEKDAGGNIIGHREEFTITSKDIQHAEDHPDMYHSIPLTEEWLERMGFKGRFLDLPCGGYIEVTANEGVIMPVDGASGGHTIPFPCQYVHQLQNLYLALTGQEITIIEPA